MTSPDFAAKVTKAYWLGKQIKALETERTDLLDSLGVTESANYPAGDFILKVTPTIRFDAATAKRNLTPEEFDSIIVPKPDSAKAKVVLGDDYGKTQKVYGLTRAIVRVEDEE